MQAIKSVKQEYSPTLQVQRMLETLRCMVNECIRIGLESNASTLKRLSFLSYRELAKYNNYSDYKLCAISKAAGILSARKKSIKRGFKPRSPYVVKPLLTGYRRFKIVDKSIRIPLGEGQYLDVPLNKHPQSVLLSDPAIVIRSFTLTTDAISITYSKEVNEINIVRAAGLDRNLRNLTYGNRDRVIHYDLSQALEVAETTKDVIRSFKCNDARIRKELASKYGWRRKNRINQMLRRVSKHLVQQAVENKEAIVFEDITNIRRLYQRGNGQHRAYRRMMNSWSFAEIKRQIEYKAACLAFQ